MERISTSASSATGWSATSTTGTPTRGSTLTSPIASQCPPSSIFSTQTHWYLPLTPLLHLLHHQPTDLATTLWSNPSPVSPIPPHLNIHLVSQCQILTQQPMVTIWPQWTPAACLNSLMISSQTFLHPMKWPWWMRRICDHRFIKTIGSFFQPKNYFFGNDKHSTKICGLTKNKDIFTTETQLFEKVRLVGGCSKPA